MHSGKSILEYQACKLNSEIENVRCMYTVVMKKLCAVDWSMLWGPRARGNLGALLSISVVDSVHYLIMVHFKCLFLTAQYNG